LHQPPLSFGFDSKWEELGMTGRPPVLKYRVPRGSQCTLLLALPFSSPSFLRECVVYWYSYLLSHNLPLPHVHYCGMGRLVHAGMGLSSLVAHVLQYPPPPSRLLRTYYKAVRVGRRLCGRVCPSRTSERGGEGDCVKEGGGEEGERERERALGLLLCHSPGH
jgi:hypothetical protein